MECPRCKHANPPTALRCEHCGTSFESDATITTGGGTSGWSAAAAPSPALAEAPLQIGQTLGGRYEILKLLGEGGMGAVYKARDIELDRVVALKVIRPELARNPEGLHRFKQELILARQVTHKNVVRIFDLGEAQGVKFITMEFVDGEDLKAILRSKQKLQSKEAIRVIAQVARALEAAHAEGVVHRDLKPHNVMVDKQGKAAVMDFGVARSLEMQGYTQTGVLIGTPEYMSPEQAKGEHVDGRSDLYSLGLIFYELLTGKTPFKVDSTIGMLMKRIQERPVPPVELERDIPATVSDVVLKCLAVSPDQRYQSATELLLDLEAIQGSRPVTVLPPVSAAPQPAPRGIARYWKPLAIAVMLLAIVGAAGYWFGGRERTATVSRTEPLTVLVADIANGTGDPVFDGTLEPMLTVALEGAAFINSYQRGQARKIGAQLRPSAARLDEALARLVAVREAVSVVIAGTISREGQGYRVAVRAVDAATGNLIASREASASNKQGILGAAALLAARLRTALGDATPESVQMAAAETYTAANLEAAHTYAIAQESQWAGKWEEALQNYSKAIELDSNFGRAYASLAVMQANLKRPQEAESNFKKTLALLDSMSERERYRTLGGYYLIHARNYERAIETLNKLVSLYPSDSSGLNNLSVAYIWTRNIPQAVAASKRALVVNPSNLQHRFNFAQYSMYAGDFDTAIAGCQKILKENQTFEYAFVPIALSSLAKGDVQVARETYGKLEQVNALGYSFARMGLPDLEMFLGRPREAVTALYPGIAADEKSNDTGMQAQKYIIKAEAHLALGDRGPAAASANKAVELSPTENVLYPAARVLVQAGDESGARKLAQKLESMLQNQTRSHARLIEGEIHLQRKRLPEAVDAFREARKLLDSWIVHFLLGRAYLEAGNFAEALAEFEICLKRRGETTDLMFTDTTTLRYLPAAYYWLGRAQEGAGMSGPARSSYQHYLKLRAEASAADPLAADAKRRAGS